jgi:hypothetical protein
MELTNDRPVRSVHADRPAALHAVPGLHPSAESQGSGTQRNRCRYDRRRRLVTSQKILNIEENTRSIQPSSVPNRFLDGFDDPIACTLGTALYSVSSQLVLNFGTCTVVSVNETLVEAKMCTFALESTHFICNKCPIYTHDGIQVPNLELTHTKRITVWGDNITKVGVLSLSYVQQHVSV